MDKGGSVSRRDFLKVAGIAGATIGLGAGLGGLVAACGGTEETTTTAGGATTTTAGGATTTSVAASTTTVSAGPEAGREIKIGVVSPQTGGLALYAKPDKWVVDQVAEAVKDGVVCGDGKNHPISFNIQDSQSTSSRSAQVAGDLILNAKVDMILVSYSPDNVNPAADQAEAYGVPLLANFVPWQAFTLARGATADKPFKWTYMFHFGLEDVAQTYVGAWDQLPTNKKVGLLYPNDADGGVWSKEDTGLPHYITEKGYTYVLPGLHDPEADDFTQQIGEFKKNGCEICAGAEKAGTFTNFWKQALQQGYRPKIVTFGKALPFHEGAVALGDSIAGLTTEMGWHRDFPYKSSLSGETCRELADRYEEETGLGWSSLGGYGKFEWAIDVLKRVTDIEDKELYPTAIQATKMETTICGPIDYTLPVKAGTAHPVLNACKIHIAQGQWVKTSEGKWPYEVVLVYSMFPDIKATAGLQPIVYQ